MLLPKGGINWKAARASLPPSRAIWVFLTKTRFLLFVAVAGAVLLLWRGISTSASEMHKCAPPPQAPPSPPDADAVPPSSAPLRRDNAS